MLFELPITVPAPFDRPLDMPPITPRSAAGLMNQVEVTKYIYRKDLVGHSLVSSPVLNATRSAHSTMGLTTPAAQCPLVCQHHVCTSTERECQCGG